MTSTETLTQSDAVTVAAALLEANKTDSFAELRTMCSAVVGTPVTTQQLYTAIANIHEDTTSPQYQAIVLNRATEFGEFFCNGRRRCVFSGTVRTPKADVQRAVFLGPQPPNGPDGKPTWDADMWSFHTFTVSPASIVTVVDGTTVRFNTTTRTWCGHASVNSSFTSAANQIAAEFATNMSWHTWLALAARRRGDV